MKSYIFDAELVQEQDGRWSAGVPSLVGCATWGHTKEEALKNLHDAVELYLKDMQKTKQGISMQAPREVRETPVIAVTL